MAKCCIKTSDKTVNFDSKSESYFYRQLEIKKAGGIIKNFWYGSFKFKLADACYYTPDFAIHHNDNTLEFVEIKGFWRDDAKVKFKVARDSFPFRFTAYKYIKGSFVKEDISDA